MLNYPGWMIVFTSRPPSTQPAGVLLYGGKQVRIILALAVVVTTAFYRGRAELPGWVEMLKGRNIRALRRR